MMDSRSLLRLVLRYFDLPADDVSLGPVDFLFRFLTSIETSWLRCGWSLPFGGSVLIKAVKHG